MYIGSMCSCVSCSVVSDSLWLHGLKPSRLLCPWNSPGKNSGLGCPFLLLGIFLNQGLNPSLLHCIPYTYRKHKFFFFLSLNLVTWLQAARHQSPESEDALGAPLRSQSPGTQSVAYSWLVAVLFSRGSCPSRGCLASRVRHVHAPLTSADFSQGWMDEMRI